MLGRTWIGLAALSALSLGFQSAQAQSTFKSGYYEITSGLYTECCGIAANTFKYELPDERQKFVELMVDPGSHTARLTFLNPDLRTVFTSYPWFPETTFAFSFSNGVVFPDHIQFGDGPLDQSPETPGWNYVVRNSGEGLEISGIAISSPFGAADVPTHFEHNNVLATFLPNPIVIDRIQRDGDSMLFHFTGRALYDYYIEYSDSLTTPNWQTQAGYRAKIAPVDVVVTNSLSAASMRYFRVRSEPCNCR